MKKTSTVLRLQLGDERMLLPLMSVFSCLLLSVRIAHTGSLDYAFLAFNLFLAWIPFGIAKILQRIPNKTKPAAHIFLLLAWMTFLPNTAYLITDIFHLDNNAGAPQWYDLLMLFAFAWNGVLLAMHAVYILHKKYFDLAINRSIGLLLTVVFFLTGMGVYVGRYLRWNSWEAFTQPRYILHQTVIIFSHSSLLFEMLAMGIVYGAFLGLAYLRFFKTEININVS